jgi:membrane-associated protease RseP (regulator of RpoE activity)
LSNDTPSQAPFSSPENDAPLFAGNPNEPLPLEPTGLRQADAAFLYQPRLRFQHVWWKHILLFVLTFITTTLVGADRYYAFLTDFGRVAITPDLVAMLPYGLWYSGTILAILGAHEMGHYVACRIYRVDATLPYFLPLYFPGQILQIGTLGAVIRIREAFPNRKILFDVGIAGPIAGFVVLVPALFVGLYLSAMTTIPDGTGLTFIGKPLLFRIARWLVFGPVPDGSIVNLHPIVFAAWFGMLATALNLLPFGQLDGGHITYATLGRISTPISLATVASALVMTFISLSWVLMTVLMVMMLLLFGPRHPPVIDEHDPIGPGRRRLALFALVMLILCFTPIPIEF